MDDLRTILNDGFTEVFTYTMMGNIAAAQERLEQIALDIEAMEESE